MGKEDLTPLRDEQDFCWAAAGRSRRSLGFITAFIGSGFQSRGRAEQITELLQTFSHHSVLAWTELLLGPGGLHPPGDTEGDVGTSPALPRSVPLLPKDVTALRDSRGQPHQVVATVEDGVELTDENVTQNPEGSCGRGDVVPLEATHAEGYAITRLLGKEKWKVGDEPRAHGNTQERWRGRNQRGLSPLGTHCQLLAWGWATSATGAAGIWGAGSHSHTTRV